MIEASNTPSRSKHLLSPLIAMHSSTRTRYRYIINNIVCFHLSFWIGIPNRYSIAEIGPAVPNAIESSIDCKNVIVNSAKKSWQISFSNAENQPTNSSARDDVTAGYRGNTIQPSNLAWKIQHFICEIGSRPQSHHHDNGGENKFSKSY